jgi:ribosomal protein S6--L-glutamate ligase
MLKIGVVGVPGGWSSEKMASAVEKKTGFRFLLEMHCTHYDSQRESLFHGEVDLLGLDGLIVKKIGARYSPDHLQRLEMLRYLSERGTRVFSDPAAITRCLDRLSCTLALRLGGIPMPETVMTENIQTAETAVRRFKTAVLKPLFTSKARGMHLISGDDPAVKEKIVAFKAMGNCVLYIQKKIDIPGRDLGIAFLRGRYVGSYARIAPKDSWNTTTVNGGRYEAVEPASEIIELASRAAALFELDFTCVDVVESEAGPMVFEVSALGGFRGLWEAQGIDMATMIVDDVVEAISHAGI